MSSRQPLRFAIAIFFCAVSARAETLEETAAQIAAAGQQTVQRLQKDSAAWTTTIELQGGAAKAIIVRADEPNRRLMSVSIATPGGPQEVTRIIERDGLWYVSDQGRNYKCRPYTAPLTLPAVYQFLSMAELTLFPEVQDPAQLGQLESVSDGIAYFRTPLAPEKVEQLRAALPMLEHALTVEDADVDAIRAQQAQIKELIDKGLQLVIDLKDGYLIAGGAPGQRITVEEFRWLRAGEAKAFEIEGVQWEDRTDSLVADPDSRPDLMMMSHCPAWQPGGQKLDSDTVLLNIESGRLSRVPFQLGISLPGCFSADRTKVYVTGILASEGGGGLFEIDLESGENRRLATGQIQGMPMFPALSPDGKTLVVLGMAPGMHAGSSEAVEDMLKSQLYIVNVATGRAKPIGKPLDTAFLSWLPDRKGLLLISRRFRSTSEPSIDSLARFNPDNTITELRPGTWPRLVLGGKRILYLDNETKLWHTCDLSGANPTLVGDGLAGFNFATPSPTGDRAVLMKSAPETGPRPYVVEVRTGEATPIPVGNGLWEIPVWQ